MARRPRPPREREVHEGDVLRPGPLGPEAAANPGGARPHRRPTRPEPARLYDGHLTAECSLRFNGAPACPACLSLVLARRDR